MGQAGIETLRIEQIKRVLPERDDMKAKLSAALEKMVNDKSDDERLLEIQFGGKANRSVTIQMTRRVPKWRATYTLYGNVIQQRIIFENDTQHAWNDIEVVFTDRSPVLFQVPLYQMAYPELPILTMPDRPAFVPQAMQESLTAYDPNVAVNEDQLVFADDVAPNQGMGGGMEAAVWEAAPETTRYTAILRAMTIHRLHSL